MANGLESSLEKELKAWRENRSRESLALSAERSKLVTPAPSASPDSRRVRVNGREVLVVSRSKRTFS